MDRPNQNEYTPYYNKYIDLVPEGDIFKILKKQIGDLEKLCKNIPSKKYLYRYAPEKWSIKEVVGHIADTERVMAFRALRFARNDNNNLPGFDQDEFVRQSNHNNIKLNDLVKGFTAVRQSNILLFKTFTDEMLIRQGVANEKIVSVRALIYVMVGHVTHHINVLKEKYLK
jgi:hypothetical protein